MDLVLVACRATGRGDRSSVRIATTEVFPGPVDLRVGADGRPRVLWADAHDDLRSGSVLRLLTCAEPRCGVK
ncbi:hypothetical protein [Streptosporangium carneum]|uniref:hypothetical protein n=1 Tax=Streptosporangium carneum TaxID=47481 RepID=UPI0022F2E86D|nr:hypothetical protein [Streptosporangium carneum]